MQSLIVIVSNKENEYPNHPRPIISLQVLEATPSQQVARDTFITLDNISAKDEPTTKKEGFAGSSKVHSMKCLSKVMPDLELIAAMLSVPQWIWSAKFSI